MIPRLRIVHPPRSASIVTIGLDITYRYGSPKPKEHSDALLPPKRPCIRIKLILLNLKLTYIHPSTQPILESRQTQNVRSGQTEDCLRSIQLSSHRRHADLVRYDPEKRAIVEEECGRDSVLGDRYAHAVDKPFVDKVA